MKLINKRLKGCYELISEPYVDERGFMDHLYDEKIFKELGLNTKWVQYNYSRTLKKNTIRGIHFSLPPFNESKLVRVISGKIMWVVVDLRRNSKTFGQWESTVLTENDRKSLYAERGFAHGMISLADNCDLVIPSDNYHSKEMCGGIIWNDKDLGIDWKLKGITPIMSKDTLNYPTLKDFKEKYGGLKI